LNFQNYLWEKTKMKNTGNTNNITHLQQFSVKKINKMVISGDLACTYNRCSSLKQDSVEWQAKITSGFVKQNNWQLVNAFGAKESAKTDDRKEFQEMLKFCKKNKISHIVFYSYDRFSRAGNLGLIDELRNQGIKIHSATQIVDDETTSGRMMQKIHLIMAQSENEQRRDKIIEGLKNKLRKGEWAVAPPIGYEKQYVTGKKEHDHDKKQCIISKEGELLRQAFQWKDRENVTNLEIISRLSSMGLILTPPRLTRIFRNPFYCGYITSNLLDVGEIIRGKHEALISEDVFLRVNGIVNENPRGWKMVRDNSNMTMKASVKCGNCNRPFTAYTKKGEYVYYKCPNQGCKANICATKLHNLFEAELLKFSLQASIIPLIKAQLEATYWMLHSSESAREKPMKDELTRLKTELEKMEFNLATSNITLELFQKFSGSHTQRIREIEEGLNIQSQSSSNLENMLENTLIFSSNLLNLWHLSDSIGKVRLQKLVFPEGLQYHSENKVLRTLKVNPIFSAITSISVSNESLENVQSYDQNEKLRQVYLMFASSNFFWEELEVVNAQMIDFEQEYPLVWQDGKVSYLNHATGKTETARFNYVSNHTLAFPEPGKMSQALFLGKMGVLTGMTSQQTSK